MSTVPGSLRFERRVRKDQRDEQQPGLRQPFIEQLLGGDVLGPFEQHARDHHPLSGRLDAMRGKVLCN